MSEEPSPPELNVRLSPIGSDGEVRSLLFKVVQGESDEAILLHRFDIAMKEPGEVEEEVVAAIDKAVRSEQLPVGVEARLTEQFRQAYFFLFFS